MEPATSTGTMKTESLREFILGMMDDDEDQCFTGRKQLAANLIYLIKIKARTNDIDRSGVDLVLSSDASQNLQQLILLYNTDVVVAGRPNSQDLTLVMLLDASAEAVSNEVWEKE